MTEEKSQAPISLQRNCEVYFMVRARGLEEEIRGSDLEDTTRKARELLGEYGRIWIDLRMDYVGYAANAEAQSRSGAHSVRLDTWEVFESDLIYCPAGANRLDPKWYAYAEAAQAS